VVEVAVVLLLHLKLLHKSFLLLYFLAASKRKRKREKWRWEKKERRRKGRWVSISLRVQQAYL
jgi:hypothetical protein